MKYISQQKDIPLTKHLAVIHFDSIYIPGDERSRSCPGHGYPGGTETSLKYIVMENEAELAKWIEDSQKYGQSKRYVVIEAQGKEVVTNLQVRLK